MDKDELEQMERDEQRRMEERENERRIEDAVFEHERELNELRLRIAKIILFKDGWYLINSSLGWFERKRPGCLIESTCLEKLPDWPCDIAAAWELEDEIPEDQRNDYARRLAKIILDDWPMFKTGANVMWWSLAHATPEQRCRAYLAWQEAVQQAAQP
jgi:hypothetical protein